jgi:hypothetical protein
MLLQDFRISIQGQAETHCESRLLKAVILRFGSSMLSTNVLQIQTEALSFG